jgi:hypothetical protein
MFSTQKEACFTTDPRTLSPEEIDAVAGGLISPNSYSTGYQGGNDGYGGSRRNP